MGNALMPLRKRPLWIADDLDSAGVPRGRSGILELGSRLYAPVPNSHHARDLGWQKPASSTADTSLGGQRGRDGPERQPRGAQLSRPGDGGLL